MDASQKRAGKQGDEEMGQDMTCEKGQVLSSPRANELNDPATIDSHIGVSLCKWNQR